MGKSGKKQKQNQRTNNRQRFFSQEDDVFDNSSDYPPNSCLSSEEEVDDEEEKVEEGDGNEENPSSDSSVPSKYLLYQQSVQSPKGDISYLQKFFLMYVGGRTPLHLQEDFCGTAFLSAEWLRADPRRTAIGLDLDREALTWCLKNNINTDQNDSRIFLFYGNVLQPLESKLVKITHKDLITKTKLKDDEEEENSVIETNLANLDIDNKSSFSVAACGGETLKDCALPGRDIVCAFNYSCCCLHKRSELVSYYRHARSALSSKGGIFVLDLYGGSSSEHAIKLKRKFPNFTYTWEQEGFDIIQRMTRISLHYDLYKPKKKIRHAFSYSWRLWSLPEIRDCLEEAGFKSVHFWIREMPDSDERRVTKGLGALRDGKYKEASSFEQLDSWNAYVVAVA